MQRQKFMNDWTLVERSKRRKTEVLAQKPVPLPLCPPQISGIRAKMLETKYLIHGKIQRTWSWTLFRTYIQPRKYFLKDNTTPAGHILHIHQFIHAKYSPKYMNILHNI